jgi:hypothetical protein
MAQRIQRLPTAGQSSAVAAPIRFVAVPQQLEEIVVQKMEAQVVSGHIADLKREAAGFVGKSSKMPAKYDDESYGTPCTHTRWQRADQTPCSAHMITSSQTAVIMRPCR